jgi:DNA polymerase-3 subunit epsilon
MLLCVLDTETTGVNSVDNSITEIAWAMFDTSSNQMLSSCSYLLPTPTISEEITKLTKISSEMTNALSVRGIDGSHSLSVLRESLFVCDAIVAHNSSFDKSFLEPYLLARDIESYRKWVCSLKDLEFSIPSTKLSYMCCDLGIPVVGAHRAMSDVSMLCQLLSKLPNLEEQIRTILTVPAVEIIANVSFKDKELAKNAGFFWNAESKSWSKVIRKTEDQIREYVRTLPFSVTVNSVRS